MGVSLAGNYTKALFKARTLNMGAIVRSADF
jgi:hypothetical protein